MIEIYDTDIRGIEDWVSQYDFTRERADKSAGDGTHTYNTYDFFGSGARLSHGMDIDVQNLYFELGEYFQLPPIKNLESCYVNVLNSTDKPGVHCDCSGDGEYSPTILVYCNNEWNYNWGGETVFFDENLDVKKAVLPKPGRVVVFDGRIPHTARPPVSIFEGNRYILTFKYNNFVNDKTNDFGIEGFNKNTIKQLWENYNNA